MNTNLIAASHGFNIMGLGLSQGKPLHREGAVQRESNSFTTPSKTLCMYIITDIQSTPHPVSQATQLDSPFIPFPYCRDFNIYDISMVSVRLCKNVLQEAHHT